MKCDPGLIAGQHVRIASSGGQGAQHSERTGRTDRDFPARFRVREARHALRRGRSTSIRSVSISERRAPVRMSSRKAAMARQSSAVVRRGRTRSRQPTWRAGPGATPSASACRSAFFPLLRLRGLGSSLGRRGPGRRQAGPAPARSGARSRCFSGGTSPRGRHGLGPSGRSRDSSGLPRGWRTRSASARLAAMGVSRIAECRRSPVGPCDLAHFLRNEGGQDMEGEGGRSSRQGFRASAGAGPFGDITRSQSAEYRNSLGSVTLGLPVASVPNLSRAAVAPRDVRSPVRRNRCPTDGRWSVSVLPQFAFSLSTHQYG